MATANPPVTNARPVISKESGDRAVVVSDGMTEVPGVAEVVCIVTVVLPVAVRWKVSFVYASSKP